MHDSIISVENISKQYRIGSRDVKYQTFREAMIHWAKTPLRNLNMLRGLTQFNKLPSNSESDTIWALRDISFEVAPGDRVGIIGHNGAGKTTLLKILSRITEPTNGKAIIRGRIASLLEVGTGFHPELTGRENIFLNGTIMGMSKSEIKRKFDEIVSFSGVEKCIDTPVKRYS